MTTYLLDTNVITPLLKRQGEDSNRIKNKLQDVLKENAVIIISPVVYYEQVRGLYHKDTSGQLNFLNRLMELFKWCDLDKITWDMGARLWAKCRTKGTPTGKVMDNDVLIAAQAQQHNATIVTLNKGHFEHLGATFEKW